MMILGQACAARWHRREYLRQHEKQRRAGLKAEGARRVDITLRGKALDDYATVRRYVEGLNQLIAEREIKQPPIRLSDTEIIKMALSYAADAMREADDKAAKQGLVMLGG